MLKNLKKNVGTNIIPSGYKDFLSDLKEKIRSSQLKAVVKVNQELIKLYFEIGKKIVKKQSQDKWGSKVIEKLCKDLQNSFPGIKGFSRSNILYMKAFYLAYEKVQQAVGQFEKLPIFRIPWGHNIALITRIKDERRRIWYASMAIQEGWSRSYLEDMIKSKYHERWGKAVTNFKDRLPEPQSIIAQETLKDPYNFDFIELADGYKEKELEQGLIDHIEKFLLELGSGFAFIGRQYHIEFRKKDYYLDLLFYHVKLKCYCIIELKNTDFKPEYIGKMNFYLSAVDNLVKQETDNPSIGMILCKTKDNFTVEYALRNIHNPMGVSEYNTKIIESLPQDLKGSLPTIEELEAEFSKNTKEKN
ncbi:MAG: YhcG family protein [Candidatus Thorarchaeota archaeon]